MVLWDTRTPFMHPWLSSKDTYSMGWDMCDPRSFLLPLCSGGSGRTGTYIAIANLLDRLKTEGVVDIFQTVRAMRMQRPRMVHTLVSGS